MKRFSIVERALKYLGREDLLEGAVAAELRDDVLKYMSVSDVASNSSLPVGVAAYILNYVGDANALGDGLGEIEIRGRKRLSSRGGDGNGDGNGEEEEEVPQEEEEEGRVGTAHVWTACGAGMAIVGVSRGAVRLIMDEGKDVEGEGKDVEGEEEGKDVEGEGEGKDVEVEGEGEVEMSSSSSSLSSLEMLLSSSGSCGTPRHILGGKTSLLEIVEEEYVPGLRAAEDVLKAPGDVFGPWRVVLANNEQSLVDHSAMVLDTGEVMHILVPVAIVRSSPPLEWDEGLFGGPDSAGAGSNSSISSADGRMLLARKSTDQAVMLLMDAFARARDVYGGAREALRVVGKFLDADLAIMSRVEENVYTVEENWTKEPGALDNGTIFELGGTYCAITLETSSLVAIPLWSESPFRAHPCYSAFGLESYIGVPIMCNKEIYGTINFTTASPRETFSDPERYLVRLMGVLISKALDEAALAETAAGLKQLNQSLDQKVEARTRELEQMAEKAQTALRAKTHFLGVVSHELRTPLHSISAMLAFLSESQVDEHQTQFISSALEEVASLRKLIESVLELSRAEHMAKYDPIAVKNSSPFYVNDAVEGVFTGLSQLAEKRNILLEKNISGALEAYPVASVARGGLDRVLFNLVENAIKYSRPADEVGPTGSWIRISADWTLVSGSTIPQLRISVADNGIGMSRVLTDRIFNPFVQGETGESNPSTTAHHSRLYGGIGLGLSITQVVVTRMGGTISVSSSPGEGSTFVVIVPAKSAQPREEAEEGEAEEAEGEGEGEVEVEVEEKKKVAAVEEGEGEGEVVAVGVKGIHILAVDDVLINRMILQQMCDSLPFEVHITMAENGAEAVSAVDAISPSKFDLICMDISMPVMNGLVATEKIRSLPGYGKGEVSILGISAAAVEEECLEVGMDAFLMKPHSSEEFCGVVVGLVSVGERQ